MYARNLEISCNYCGSVTINLPYGSTHPAPPLLRVLEAAYCEDIVKPVQTPTNPRKHSTQHKFAGSTGFKTSDDCLSDPLSQELQSSVRPGQRCRPVGGCRLKSGLFNRYVIVGISEAFGVAIKESRLRWPMIRVVLSITALHRAQSVAGSSSRTIPEKDATGSRKKSFRHKLSGYPDSEEKIDKVWLPGRPSV